MDADNAKLYNGRIDSLTLKERIICHLVKSSATLKSQQRGEPDLTVEEKKTIALDLLDKSPGQFLYRFGKFLLLEHLQYFDQHGDKSDVAFYLAETQKLLNPHTSRIRLRNRRYGALGKLCSSGDYFSETSMRSRDPLLFEELVENNRSADEDQNKQLDLPDKSFSDFIIERIDEMQVQEQKRQQIELEDDVWEEEEESSDEEEQIAGDEENETCTTRAQQLYKDEFVSTMYTRFLSGHDRDFSYKDIDECEDYDPLDISVRDEEERYFDEEESGSCHSDDAHQE